MGLPSLARAPLGRLQNIWLSEGILQKEIAEPCVRAEGVSSPGPPTHPLPPGFLIKRHLCSRSGSLRGLGDQSLNRAENFVPEFNENATVGHILGKLCQKKHKNFGVNCRMEKLTFWGSCDPLPPPLLAGEEVQTPSCPLHSTHPSYIEPCPPPPRPASQAFRGKKKKAIRPATSRFGL